MEIKTCSKCLTIKALECFSNASGSTYKRSECKSCASLLDKHRKSLRKRYKAPDDTYICPICMRDFHTVKDDGGKASSAWVLDHNHITGDFRGFLCHRCNRSIGGFKDDVEILKRAIKWLYDIRNTI